MKSTFIARALLAGFVATTPSLTGERNTPLSSTASPMTIGPGSPLPGCPILGPLTGSVYTPCPYPLYTPSLAIPSPSTSTVLSQTGHDTSCSSATSTIILHNSIVTIYETLTPDISSSPMRPSTIGSAALTASISTSPGVTSAWATALAPAPASSYTGDAGRRFLVGMGAIGIAALAVML